MKINTQLVVKDKDDIPIQFNGKTLTIGVALSAILSMEKLNIPLVKATILSIEISKAVNGYEIDRADCQMLIDNLEISKYFTAPIIPGRIAMHLEDLKDKAKEK